jgi:LysM repeat protein
MAVLVLVSLLSLGFGLLQMLSHPDGSTLAQADLGTPTSTNASVLSAAAIGGSEQSLVAPPAGPAPRAIQSSAKVLEPDYTVAAGDTLGKIAQKYNTSVERIEAFNNLADPRALRIGAKLIIPPAF